MAEPLACSVYGLERVELRFHETALIIGAGTIGLGALINVKALGARAIIIARHPQQQKLARELGADEVLGDDDSGRERLEELVKLDAIDLAIETVGGHGDTLNQALCSVRPLGRVLVLGVFFRPTVEFKSFQIMDRAIIGAVLYGNMSGKANYQMAMEVLTDHGEAARQLVTHRFGLEDVNQGFAAAMDKSQQSVKVHIQPGA
jgi:threonine dehydrogenase-like Zn-dependent dehydrogenase